MRTANTKASIEGPNAIGGEGLSVRVRREVDEEGRAAGLQRTEVLQRGMQEEGQEPPDPLHTPAQTSAAGAAVPQVPAHSETVLRDDSGPTPGPDASRDGAGDRKALSGSARPARRAATISSPQLKRLQTSWGQYARRTVLPGDPREERLRWASKALGRIVESFSKLTKYEAKQLIQALNGALGIPEKRLDRARAKAAGTEGRRGAKSTSVTLVSAEDLGDVYEMVARLGWDQDRLTAWLRAPSSPLARRAEDGTRIPAPEPTIRTLGQANRVRWALKSLLKRAGKWRAKMDQTTKQEFRNAIYDEIDAVMYDGKFGFYNVVAALDRAVAKFSVAKPRTRPLDGKFSVKGSVVFNAVSGQAIPDDEPLFVLRARDQHAYATLMHYLALCSDDCNELHQEGIKQQIRKFIEFANVHPERMKQPGITGHLRLEEPSKAFLKCKTCHKEIGYLAPYFQTDEGPECYDCHRGVTQGEQEPGEATTR